MTWLRGLILILMIGGIAGFSYYFFGQTEQGDPSLVFQALKPGRYIEAHALLDSMEKKLPQPQAHLLRAYLLREEGIYDKSDQQLTFALCSTRSHKKMGLRWELHLNKALNALLEKQPFRAAEALAAARELRPDHPYSELLAAITDYQLGRYADAARILGRNVPEEDPIWLGQALQIHFPEGWQTTALARCAIEMLDYGCARDIIEASAACREPPFHEESAFLLQLSFLREAKSKPVEARLVDYLAAAETLARWPKNQIRYRETLCRELLEASSLLANAGIIGPVSFFAQLLERWGNATVAHDVAQTILSSLHHEALALPTFKGLLARELAMEAETRLLNAISSSRDASLAPLWDIAFQFSPDREGLKDRVLEETQVSLIRAIDESGNDLSRAQSHIDFFCHVAPYETSYLAGVLLTHSEEIWSDRAHQMKAFPLMCIAAKLTAPHELTSSREAIATMLNNVAEQALEENDMDTLTLVHTAADHFLIESFHPEQKREIANQLADATHYFQQEDYIEAMKVASGVIQLDPKNEYACELLGQITFVLSRYSEAIKYLRRIRSPDGKTVEMLGVCEILCGDPIEGERLLRLAFVDQGFLSDRGCLFLGYRALEAGAEEEASEWLEQIGVKDSEVYALLAYAAFSQRDWHKCLKFKVLCNDLYRSHKGVTLLSALSYLALGQPDKAQSHLRQLERGREPSSAHFPELFNHFFARQLTSQDALSLFPRISS